MGERDFLVSNLSIFSEVVSGDGGISSRRVNEIVSVALAAGNDVSILPQVRTSVVELVAQ